MSAYLVSFTHALASCLVVAFGALLYGAPLWVAQTSALVTFVIVFDQHRVADAERSKR